MQSLLVSESTNKDLNQSNYRENNLTLVLTNVF